MSDHDIFESRFTRLIIGHAKLECLLSGGRRAVAPVSRPAARSVPRSDLPDDRVMRFDETDGAVSVFETPCGFDTHPPCR